MHCLLFRHGIAFSPDDWDGSENDRPLTKEGILKTEQAAKGLQRLQVTPTHILCSPLIRTRQTADIVKEILQIQAPLLLCPELVYDQSPMRLFPILQKYSPDSFVLCVGHEPHLGQTAALMIFGNHAPGLSLKKAGGCQIYFEGTVGIGRGNLMWWMPPAQLRMLRKGSE